MKTFLQNLATTFTNRLKPKASRQSPSGGSTPPLHENRAEDASNASAASNSHEGTRDLPMGNLQPHLVDIATDARDTELPQFFVHPQHPRRPAELVGLGRDFVYGWHSKDLARAEAFSEYARDKLGIPKGPNAKMPSKGLYELTFGDLVWARDLDGNDFSGDDDVLQIFVVDPSEYSAEFEKKFRELRTRTLGERNSRDARKVPFEMSGRATKTKGGRCYPCGLNTQKPRNVAGPSAGGKVWEGDISDPDLKLRSDLLRETIVLGMTSLRRRYPECVEVLNTAAELFNTPRIGCHQNCCFSGGQLNLQTPYLWLSEDELKEMGFFGQLHCDGHDSVAGYSMMYTDSDLPEGYEGGRFHFVELGCYVKLEGLRVMGFSGLRWHGGTPPLAPPHIETLAEIEPWAIRWVFILYPQRAVLDGGATMNVAANADHSPFQVTRGMKIIDEESGNSAPLSPDTLPHTGFSLEAQSLTVESDDMYTQEVNFATDGPVFMEKQDLVDYTARSTFFATTNIMRQLGGTTTTNYEAYRQAISSDGSTPSPWVLAPDGSPWVEAPLSPDLLALTPRQLAKQGFELMCASHARFIPNQMRKYKSLLNPLPEEVSAEPSATKAVTGRPRDKKTVKPAKASGRKKKVDTGVRSVLMKGNRYSTISGKHLVRDMLKKTAKQKQTTKKNGMKASRMIQARRSIHVGSTAGAKGKARKRASSSALDERVHKSARIERLGRKDVPEEQTLTSEAEYEVSAIKAHRVRKNAYEFLCSWEAEEYDPEWVWGYDMSSNTMLRVYCRKHDLDYTQVRAQNGDIEANDAENGGGTTESCEKLTNAPGLTPEDIIGPNKAKKPEEEFTESETESTESETADCESDEESTGPALSGETPMGILRSTMFGNVYQPDEDNEDIGTAAGKGGVLAASWTSRAGTPFLRSLTPESIPWAVGVFLQAVSSVQKETFVEDTRKMWDLYKVLAAKPWEDETAKCVADSWPLLRTLSQHIHKTDAEAMVMKQIVMQFHYNVSVWLSACVSNFTSGTSWASRMLRRLSRMVTSGEALESDLVFCSSDFIPSIIPVQSITIPQPAKTRHPHIDRTIINLALQILSCWLSIPPTDYVKTQFLATVLKHSPSTSILLLKEVWEAYLKPEYALTPVKRGKRQPTSTDFEELDRILQNHPIMTDTQSRDGLVELDQLCAQFMSRSPQIISSSISDLSQLAPPGTLTGIPARQPELEEEQVAHQKECHLTDVGKQSFRQMLLDCYEVGTGKTAKTFKWQAKFLRREDYYQPLREMAPSRLKVTREGGPFSSKVALTRAGIFSALVFRGILFSTKACLEAERPLLFADLNDWTAFCASHPGAIGLQGNERESFFCNKMAYGRTVGRSTKNATAFWEASEEVLELVKSNRGSFSDLFRTLKSLKSLPTFGPLATYLLMVDFAYADIVCFPTLDEMADIVVGLNKGAAKTLRRFGCGEQGKLVKGRKAGDDAEIKQGFICLYQYLESEIDVETRRKIGFDVFVLEHGLCKYGRIFAPGKDVDT